MAMQQYDPAKLLITANGVPITGYAPDTFAQIRSPNDLFTLTVGADGGKARAKSNDKRGEITITLMPGSPGNAVFQALLIADKAKDGAGVFILSITDPSTLTEHFGQEAWVRKDPDVDYASTTTPKVWIIDVAELQAVNGVSPT